MRKFLIWVGVMVSEFFYSIAEMLSNHRDQDRKVDEYLDRIEEHLNDEEEDIPTTPHISKDILPDISELTPELPVIKLDFSKLQEALAELEALEALESKAFQQDVPPELPPNILMMRKDPVIKDMNGKVIPTSNKDEELPAYQIFKAMFERKFGRFGLCPLQISGHMKDFNCDELYSFLYQIRYVERPEPTLSALYGAVIEVIIRGHGETLEAKSLN